jgi:uncharacterized protein (TIGR03083 family)
MNTSENDVQALVGPQLQALADALGAEPASIADAPSLCEGWAVKNVVAHMTMAARYDGPAFMAELAAVGHDFGALSEKLARRDGELAFGTLLDDLRCNTMAVRVPPGGGAIGALSHVVIHSLDISTARDLPRTADDQATLLVLTSLAQGGVATHFGVDPTGLLLKATDLGWQLGAGEPAEATAADLILALAGRPRPGIRMSAK